jgi:hypothetical protein
MSNVEQPELILKRISKKASSAKTSVIAQPKIRECIEYVCGCTSNRSGVRLLMSCLLAKLDRPEIDPRQPYTEIGGEKSFSGRTYDERYITKFITENRLPVNSTTAYLTPTLRNIGRPLSTKIELVGRPKDLYQKAIQVLDAVATGAVDAESTLVETVRLMFIMRDANLARMTSLIDSLKRTEGALPLSSEAIVNLIGQHLACRNSSRLPVLIVAAAYDTVGAFMKEKILTLHPHNAADSQTGSLGDVEICIIGEDAVVTSYEMKMKLVSFNDIDVAVTKIRTSSSKINNYIFITTEPIDPTVAEYAASFYERMDGTEIVILDCIGFLRHFLHLFHRLRSEYLNAYQRHVVAEPDSAVSQSLKEAFLALRQVAESNE